MFIAHKSSIKIVLKLKLYLGIYLEGNITNCNNRMPVLLVMVTRSKQ